MSDLPNFLLARIAEDEECSGESWDAWHTVRCGVRLGCREDSNCSCDVPVRLLAKCAADRDIVREHQGYGGICGTCGVRKPATGELWPCRTLRLLALPYADHADYRQEWRP